MPTEPKNFVGFLCPVFVAQSMTQQALRLSELSILKTLKTILSTFNESSVKRGLATARITGNSLYAVMKRFERDNPRLCAECHRHGRVRYGDELEHIVPLWQGGAESDSNREWICRDDHKIKTAREASMRRAG